MATKPSRITDEISEEGERVNKGRRVFVLAGDVAFEATMDMKFCITV